MLVTGFYMLPSILALQAFAASIKDQPNTPCLRYVDSSSQCSLHGKSISLTQGVSGQNTITVLKVNSPGQMSPKSNHCDGWPQDMFVPSYSNLCSFSYSAAQIQTDKHRYRQTNTDRQTDKQMDRHPDTQTDATTGAGTVWSVWAEAHTDFWPCGTSMFLAHTEFSTCWNGDPRLLSLNQCHMAKYQVCEYGAVICVGFL